MKKITTLLLVLIATLALAACGTDGEGAKTTDVSGLSAPDDSEIAGNVVRLETNTPSAAEIASACNPGSVLNFETSSNYKLSYVVCSDEPPAP